MVLCFLHLGKRVRGSAAPNFLCQCAVHWLEVVMVVVCITGARCSEAPSKHHHSAFFYSLRVVNTGETDQGCCHPKHVHVQTVVGSSSIRLHCSSAPGWCMGEDERTMGTIRWMVRDMRFHLWTWTSQFRCCPRCLCSSTQRGFSGDVSSGDLGCALVCASASVMAFAPSTKLYPCRVCGNENGWHKMMVSQRSGTSDVGEDNVIKYWRICLICENKFRDNAWLSWTDEQKKDAPDYTKMVNINRDKNYENKGEMWVQRTKFIVQAKRELAEEATMGVEGLSGDLKKRAIRKRATSLAQAFIEALKEQNLTDVFGGAGERLFAAASLE